MEKQSDFISIIIPVYKQEKTIRKDIENALVAFSELPDPFEIIVVIDGVADNSWNEAKKVKDKKVVTIGYRTNHGKGYAVRFGFAKAQGTIIGFMDAGGDLKSTSLPLMYQQFQFQKADIVMGSKRHPMSKVHYPNFRRILSWGYQMIVRVLFGLDVKDTQVGMKLYRRRVLEDVLPRVLVKEFAFDIEILAVSYALGYRKIYEAPIELDFSGITSSITSGNTWKVIVNMLRDTLAVFYRLKILHYYDAANKRKWRFDPELNFRINIG
jgi:glycosyltransferase involved in cell wall biosynthesis